MQISKQDSVQVERSTTQQKMEFQSVEQNAPEIKEVKKRQDQSKNNEQNNSSMQQRQERFIKAAEQVLSEDGEKVNLQFSELRFAQHEKTNRMVITVVDRDTEEVIREIPSEKILDMVAQMWDAAGLFVDESR
ncbi:flagellar protein FlaG [Candidatus Epulonipiscium viviparus]|uniref:flagellar protein FlaG n=1 Tax=Candidatus Epulonipiscium viviparus TaxID=420336 RepID=UPI00016C05FF|nr:flagellar protein FlaG [Candidatus Epulopiscium viviparus]